ncbi:class I SAM-dependent methyltransferase [Paenibacillus sp. FSL R7-0048]|jgi:ubiquinone/menaquinone biosynthesis C-methylase UbiE|uniref:SAM-dependent methyltransferase n=1 Tax=Paenibacillus odorifer TaxID=189426 RepID=A0ABX3GYQ8_9BACL|nr:MULTISPECIES: class I SAM-dependent methyltransferase [Paenibacillus]MDH6428587.1 ubiquinone/menaquinone biosynthesis C-methylase UbiE [Paenibacillus sp. PastH-4]MDH6443775.1 ubiquinone/menaquinone biosynthesis C-methylase UbiE [Paenibacillus sp. PastF-4]MDH6527683.1 ubiquinone/menaquinone biosynthesis C-methylase UbiE [Paenibacillus sp. PastH-3]OMC80817.1 SAM-dependent methyltransferase [Paenibacillus odorifer]OMD28611.1 SAM-dependent methyltransferase [Paenibacillus odorifer]
MEEQNQYSNNQAEKNAVPTSEELWNEDTYTAWVTRFGTPSEAAAKLIKEPSAKLHPLLSFFGEVKSKKMMNLMGSNGMKAVALSLLGAEVTVADFSEANARYAADLAQEAGVPLTYIVSDILKLPEDVLDGSYDIVFAELGIVHYFTNLTLFMETARRLLSPGGVFVLRDFHPVTTKLISSKGSTAKVRKHKVNGDYFDSSLEEKKVSYSKYLPSTGKPAGEQEHSVVYWRRWTLGEIVTAAANSGLVIRQLVEEPNLSSDVYDKGIPKTFTLVAGNGASL